MSLIEKALEKAKDDRAADPQLPNDGAVDQPRHAPSRLRPSAVQSRLLGPDDTPPTLVVHIDRGELSAAGVIPLEADRPASAEQYRVIKQDLVRYREAKAPEGSAPPQYVMVTSAQPGDGKTFTSVNLALSMTTERDHDVLLIDGDVAKRHITRSLGLADAPGLLDVLRDPQRRFASVIYATDVPRLQVLPVGAWSEDATELLSSERMRQFMREMHERFPQRMVVLDSSPVLLLPDARVLAAMVGQIVLVVKAGTTLQHDVKEAAALLNGPGRRLSLVLNQMESNDLLDSVVGYRYGYGYGYGQNAAQGSDGSDSTPTG